MGEIETPGEDRAQTSRSLTGAFKPQGLRGPLPGRSFWSLGHSGAGMLALGRGGLSIVVPPLPGKALKRQLPFRGDEGIFEESFIEERRQGLEQFINKIAGHPLAQNERCLHMFLQEETIDRNYVPGKVRQ
uniref:Sorting nexin 12 n=1 Tax=Cyanistes caeruleus TaxID=156563 RepID=A0A8C0VF17_CYACU